MSDERIAALEKALKAILETARFENVDVDQLCEATAQHLNSSVGQGWAKTLGIDQAITEIENAKAALPPDKGVRRNQ